jgi:hypothetical protein
MQTFVLGQAMGTQMDTKTDQVEFGYPKLLPFGFWVVYR